jgi:hypothetical protein
MENITFLSATFGEELAHSSIEKLEEMAIQANKRKDKDLLEDILIIRKIKLNSKFEWTAQNKEKLLHLNDRLIDCFEKLKAEGTVVFQTLQNRLDANDYFLHDFEIEASVTPFLYEESENGERHEKDSGIEEVLMWSWKDWLLSFNISNANCFNDTLYLDRKQSWSMDYCFKGEFDDYFISYGIHDLYDHATGWSFSDILKINHLWAELKVIHQHFTDI